MFLVGLLLRDKSVHNPNTGSNWASSTFFSLVQELVPFYDVTNDTLDGKGPLSFYVKSLFDIDRVFPTRSQCGSELHQHIQCVHRPN
jgi:hypothetical protein